MYWYKNGNYYEGEFLNGKRHGQGKMEFYNGDKYVGPYEDDKMHG